MKLEKHVQEEIQHQMAKKKGFDEEPQWQTNYIVKTFKTRVIHLRDSIYKKFLHIVKIEMLLPYKKTVFKLLERLCKELNLNEFELALLCIFFSRMREFQYDPDLLRIIESKKVHRLLITDCQLSKRVKQIFRRLFLLVVTAKFYFRNYKELSLLEPRFVDLSGDAFSDFMIQPKNKIILKELQIAQVNEYVSKIQYRHSESLNGLVRNIFSK